MSIINECGRLADELVRYSRLCYDRHLVGAAGGNLSARVPGRDAFIVTASGVSLRDVARENLVVIDGSGKASGRAAGRQAVQRDRLSPGRLRGEARGLAPSFMFTRRTPRPFRCASSPFRP